MAFTVPKKTPEWMKPGGLASETIEQATKLQSQIGEAMGGATGGMLLDLQIEQHRQQRLIEKALGGAIDRALLRYSSTILDHLREHRRAQYAVDMVGLFADEHADPEQLRNWLVDNKDEMSVDDLKTIVLAAMAHGLGVAMSDRASKPRPGAKSQIKTRLLTLMRRARADGQTFYEFMQDLEGGLQDLYLHPVDNDKRRVENEVTGEEKAYTLGTFEKMWSSSAKN